MVAAQQPTDPLKDRLRHLLGARATRHLPRDVGEDLAPPLVRAEHAGGAVEARLLQVAQEGVDGGRPGAGGAPHGGVHLRNGADEATGQRFFRNGGVVERSHEDSLARPTPEGV